MRSATASRSRARGSRPTVRAGGVRRLCQPIRSTAPRRSRSPTRSPAWRAASCCRETSTRLLLVDHVLDRHRPRPAQGGAAAGLADSRTRPAPGRSSAARTPGFNDVGLMTAPDGRRYAIAVMIGDTAAPDARAPAADPGAPRRSRADRRDRGSARRRRARRPSSADDQRGELRLLARSDDAAARIR